VATAYVDSLPLLKTALASGWTSANSDGKTPTIVVSDDESDANISKRYDVGMRDFIVIYSPSRQETPVGLGAGVKQVSEFVTLDVRTGVSRAHHVKVIQELDRVLDTKFRNPVSGFQLAYASSWLPHGDKMARLWRHTRDLELVNYAVLRGS
jgi:hypothetical protein